MSKAWITTSSTHIEAMVNPLNAACGEGFVPDEIHLIENPGATEQVDRALDHATTIITAYGGEEPDIHLTSLENEVEFDRIHDNIKNTIERIHNEDGEVAVDITPGRKFMSAIAFTVGLKYGADHVFYFYLDSTEYFHYLYPDMPRTATHLYDFTEEI